MSYREYLKQIGRHFLGNTLLGVGETLFYWCTIIYLSIYLTGFNGGLFFYLVIGALTASVCREGFRSTRSLVETLTIYSVIIQDTIWYYLQFKVNQELLDTAFEIYTEGKDTAEYLEEGTYLNVDTKKLLEVMWEDKYKNDRNKRNGK